MAPNILNLSRLPDRHRFATAQRQIDRIVVVIRPPAASENAILCASLALAQQMNYLH
jgi:hypothetical protein